MAAATPTELQAIADAAHQARVAVMRDGPSVCDRAAGESAGTQIIAALRAGAAEPADAWRLLHDHLTHQTIRDDVMTQAFVTTLAENVAVRDQGASIKGGA